MSNDTRMVEKLMDALNPMVVTSEKGYAYEVDGLIITKWCKKQETASRQLRSVMNGYIVSKRRFNEHVKELNKDEERIKAWIYALSRRHNARRIAASELHFNKEKYVSLVMQETRESSIRERRAV